MGIFVDGVLEGHQMSWSCCFGTGFACDFSEALVATDCSSDLGEHALGNGRQSYHMLYHGWSLIRQSELE